MARMFFENEPCQPDNFRRDRVCPRIAKAEFGRRFFSGDFRWCFNGGAKWITQLAGVFPVGVVNTPELVALLRSHVRAHAGSSPQVEFAKMYLIHKMRGQSVRCPVSSHGKNATWSKPTGIVSEDWGNLWTQPSQIPYSVGSLSEFDNGTRYD